MRMKTRITLTVDPSVSHRAKALSRGRGMSVSSLVEHLLLREIGETAKAADTPRFSTRWAGRGKLQNKNDARFAKLKAKHGL